MENLIKSKPIPVRYSPDEGQFLREASAATGLSQSEVVRRAVRLMRRQRQLVHSYSFVGELSA